jgi:soluble lytic murein transglycosylase-like protein
MLKLITIMGLLIAPFTYAQAPYGKVPEPVVVEPPTLHEFAQNMSAKYDVSYWLIDAVLDDESGWRVDAENPELHPDGTVGSFGIAQFKPTTFYGFAEEMGMENANLDDPYQQIEVMVWAISTGYGSHWTGWRKATGYN